MSTVVNPPQPGRSAAVVPRARPRRPWLTPARAGIYGFLLFSAVFFLLPLYVMLVTSLKEMEQVRNGHLLSLPTAPGFAAWAKAWWLACTGSVCGCLKTFFLIYFVMSMPALLIYTAIGALINATKPADVITVFEQLQSLGKADDCGGLVYLNALAQSVPSAANLRRYAEIVRERSILRKLVTASDEIATTAFNPQGRAVSEIVDESERKIFQIGEMGKRNQQGFQSMDTLVVDLLDRVQEMAENPNEVTGVPTGFYDFDRMTAGLQPGDLIVLAVVSFGAEVIADGNIHVYAPLRGRAIAGARGNVNARIYSTCLEPQLVSVAGIYRTTETPLPAEVLGRPASVRLEGEKIIVEPLNG